MNPTFRIGGRGGGLVAAASPDTEVELAGEELGGEDLSVLDPAPLTETRRERLRFLRRDAGAPRRLFAPPARQEALSERLVASLGSALEKLASRETPAPILNVHLAQPELNVSVSQPAPQVNVEQPAPEVNVTVEAPEIPAPQVTVAAAPPAAVEVHVPEQPAPIVNVTNQVDVEVPRPRPIRVEELDDGTRRYVPEEE